MERFRGLYRIPSVRASWWDYHWDGLYFVTICTHERRHYFGRITTDPNGRVINNLSAIGKIAYECWQAMPDHFPFVKLGEFVVMPNHVHGIIIMDKSGSPDVETHDHASLPGVPPPRNKFGPQSRNLASVVRGFKAAVTVRARVMDPGFRWQTRYHDHIIRDDRSFFAISGYIRNNPAKWNEDRLFSDGVDQSSNY